MLKTFTIAILKMTDSKNRLMVIDALNIFLRAYIKDPSLSSNGNPVGGLKGFLRILQKLIREVGPSEVVVCWDGPGGSAKRKRLHKEYKAGRKPVRLNRGLLDLDDQQEMENKVWQQTRLFDYLNDLPIVQIMLDEVEADDVIAYVVQMPKYKDYQKVIVSSDKDFYQLCDDQTIIYRPSMKDDKKYMTKNKAIEDFKIHPANFALARAIEGDKSDNIPGIHGIALKTVAKRFPFLSENKDYSVQELINHCEETEDKNKVYDKVIENKDLILKNFNLMQLYNPTMSPNNCNVIRASIDDFCYDFSKTEVLKKLFYDGIGDVDFNTLFLYCKNVSKKNKS